MSLNIAHIAKGQDFPVFEIYKITESGGLKIDYVNLTAFFQTRGYYLHRVTAIKHILIRIVDNIVKEVGRVDLKRELLDFVCENESRFVHEFFIKNIGKATSDEFIETLESKSIHFRKDTPVIIELYFQNCIVRVTKDGIKTHPYTDLVGYIWESQIIQRKFEYFDEDPKYPGDFKRFCWNISGAAEDRYKPICSMIGFLMHNYKNQSYCPAVILNDEVISDNPEGGTGKGILIKAIRKFMKTVSIEGKTFSFDKSFVYQRVDGDTKILCFQDVKKTFDFERLFSVITDGIEVDKKGVQTVMIDFEDSPKVIISTNYAIRGEGNSHDRRRFEIEISQYYNATRTPEDEFKHLLFDGWDTQEWQRFDNFMLHCCKFYLANGLIKQKLINLEEKRLMVETSVDFLEFMATFKFETVRKADVYTDFLREYPEYSKQKWFTKQLLSKWIHSFCKHNNYTVSDYIYLSERYYKFEMLRS